MTRTAIVVGAGIAGLSAAIALKQAGFAVTLYEDAPALAPIGAAISLWGNAIAALDRLGAVAAIRQQATPIRSLAVYDQSARAIVGPVDLAAGESFLPTRTLVQSALRTALGDSPLLLGQRVASVAQDDVHATITLADGVERHADLVVVADGIWSAAATRIIGTTPVHAGYGGVLGLSGPAPRSGQPGAAREYWSGGERFGLFDLGGKRHYWFWMRNEDAAQAGRPIALGDVVCAARSWPSDIRAAIAATSTDGLIRFSIHARPPPHRLGVGRIVCVGDAAHAMEPNLGQGACQAIEDAVVLGEMAREVPVGRLAEAFGRVRLERVRDLVTSSHRAGRAVHARSRVERATTRAMLNAAPRWVAGRMIARYHHLPY